MGKTLSLANCFDCSTQDSSNLIDKFIDNLPVKKINPDKLIYFLNNYNESSSRYKECFSEFIIRSIYFNFIKVKETEAYTATYMKDIQKLINIYSDMNESEAEGELYFLLSLLFLSYKHALSTAYDLYNYMKNIILIYNKIKISESKYNKQPIMTEEYKPKELDYYFKSIDNATVEVNYSFILNLVRFYIEMTTTCIVNNVCMFSKNISEFESYWKNVFNSKRKNILIDVVFSNINKNNKYINFIAICTNINIKFYDSEDLRLFLKYHYEEEKKKIDKYSKDEINNRKKNLFSKTN